MISDSMDVPYKRGITESNTVGQLCPEALRLIPGKANMAPIRAKTHLWARAVPLLRLRGSS
jgi:hypothetical protein